MRPYIVASTVALLLLSACTAAQSGDEGTAVPSASSPAASSEKDPLDLKLPKNPAFLLPVTQGKGSQKLPAFEVSGDTYTLYVRCEGKGITAITYGNGDTDASNVKCNTVPTVGRVHADPGPQHLSVKVQGGDVRWSVAVLAGTPL
jgi:hypothetical protein